MSVAITPSNEKAPSVHGARGSENHTADRKITAIHPRMKAFIEWLTLWLLLPVAFAESIIRRFKLEGAI